MNDMRKRVCVAELAAALILTQCVPAFALAEGEPEQSCYAEQGLSKVGRSAGSANYNPRTWTFSKVSGDGTLWRDIPAGAISYNGKDSKAVISGIVYVDNTPPVISLKGVNLQTIELGGTYVELGASITDNLDPNIVGKQNIDASQVDTGRAVSYSPSRLTNQNVTATIASARPKRRGRAVHPQSRSKSRTLSPRLSQRCSCPGMSRDTGRRIALR